jgi:hypothetical protein
LTPLRGRPILARRIPFPLSAPQSQPPAPGPDPDSAAPGRQPPGPGPGATLPAPGGGRFEALPDPERRRVTLRRVLSSGEEGWRREVESGQANAAALASDAGRLFAALYARGASGARVVALDGASGASLWDRVPEGIGPVLHSKYANRVTLSAESGAVHVSGEESAGSYRETLDPATGETLAREVARR